MGREQRPRPAEAECVCVCCTHSRGGARQVQRIARHHDLVVAGGGGGGGGCGGGGGGGVGEGAGGVWWKPAFFGIKPSMIIKGGFIAAAPMGDPNASIPTPQPVHYRPMFGAFGRSVTASSVSFVSQVELEAGRSETL